MVQSQDQASGVVGLRLHPSVSTTVRPLNRLESKRTLGKNIIKYGYVPVTIEFYNNSDDVYLFRASTLNLPIEKKSDVLDAVSHNAFWITYLGVGISAIYFWPGIIPSVGVGAWMSYRNTVVARKFEQNVIEKDSSFELLPYERFQKTIILHASACPAQGTFSLFNLHTKEFVPVNFAL